jgi:hypothetical protein
MKMTNHSGYILGVAHVVAQILKRCANISMHTRRGLQVVDVIFTGPARIAFSCHIYRHQRNMFLAERTHAVVQVKDHAIVHVVLYKCSCLCPLAISVELDRCAHCHGYRIKG